MDSVNVAVDTITLSLLVIVRSSSEVIRVAVTVAVPNSNPEAIPSSVIANTEGLLLVQLTFGFSISFPT